VVANNPSMIALAEATALWPGMPVDVFVSLGTGTVSSRQGVDGASIGALLHMQDNASSVFTWARHFFESTMSCEVRLVRAHARARARARACVIDRRKPLTTTSCPARLAAARWSTVWRARCWDQGSTFA
jgi:hypothetical protein